MKDAFLKSLRICLVMLCMLAPASLFAQGVASGTVVDAEGEAVIGATVIEKGNPSNGTITDIDGKFTLNLQKGKTATISYVGMKTKDIQVGEG